ncbi:bifunctional folylpolyglutamate synthase/dihydrofolate synthase [Lichenihabitans psoromatis]|uniref:bifunctional folylpolyglutamate synthase/dihydrofolate synthase n=1 Tax=Lichenihabitans psoromatis TaxID=2528642 RepID=UPI001FDF3BD6|nr:folylpolyglutamate synthase/dihydrofolate synthase family protein [Lichenihabitans psoromatis]
MMSRLLRDAAMMPPDETLDTILSRLPLLHPKKIDLSLGRIERLLAELGHPERRLPPVIHVAGTNGKGSTVAFMRAMLEAAGRVVHVYTSPHLVRFNERIRLGEVGGGVLITDEELASVLAQCERVNAGQSISFFEILTAAAIEVFSRHPADILLLEVGLGGRYDATNVIAHPVATVITPVSIDHPEFLGTTIERIAFEKAGILKAGSPAVIAAQGADAIAVLQREADRLRVTPQIGGQDFATREERGRFVFEDERGLLDLPLPRLPGRHQQINAGAAIATMRVLDPYFPIAAIETGLSTADWPARLQRLSRGPVVEALGDVAEVWLDGGHNADGGRVLAEAMAELEERAGRPLVIVCGMLSTKDAQAFLTPFNGLAQEVLTVPVGGDHDGRTATELADIAVAAGLRASAFDTILAALHAISARVWPMSPRVLITGSLYLAGEVLTLNASPPV